MLIIFKIIIIVSYCFSVLCYMSRHNSEGCNAKEGNPFGPFWDTFGVDFIASSFYKPLSYDVHYSDQTKEWHRRFPADKWPGEKAPKSVTALCVQIADFKCVDANVGTIILYINYISALFVSITVIVFIKFWRSPAPQLPTPCNWRTDPCRSSLSGAMN